MTAQISTRAAVAVLATLLWLGWLGRAEADPSDDLGGPTNQPGGSLDKDSDYSNVELVDDGLEKKLDVVRVGSSRGGNNLLTVFAGFRNKTGARLTVEVETIYKDKAGNNLNTGTWLVLTLRPHEREDYRSSAISEAAVDFLVRVRLPNDSSKRNP